MPRNPVMPRNAVAQPDQIGERVANGFAWVGLNTLVVKFLGIATQLVLGWLLLPSDFGLVASVLAITLLGNICRLLNTNSFLTRRPNEINQWASAAIWVTALGTVLGASLLALATPFLALHESQATVFIGCMALGIVGSACESMLMPFAGVLNSRMSFGFQTRVGLPLVAMQSLLSVGLAMQGWGAFSIIAPATIASIVRLILYIRAARIPLLLVPQVHLWRKVIFESAVLAVPAIASLAITHGDYLALSIFHSDYDTGQYFFAFTIATQAVFLLSAGLSAVLLPALSRIETSSRRRETYLDCVRLLLLVAAPLCAMQTLAIEPFIFLVFGTEKWAPAVSMAILLSAGSVFRIASFPSQSFFVAEGRLKLYAGWMIGWVVVFLTAVLATSWMGNVMHVALVVTVFYAVYDPATAALAFCLGCRSSISAVRALAMLHVMPLAGCLISGGIAWCVQRWIETLDMPKMWVFLAQSATTLLVPALYLPFVMRFARSDVDKVWTIARRLFVPMFARFALFRRGESSARL